MHIIRRIYFYLVSFISAMTLIWGITNLLRSIFRQQVAGDQSSILSAGLAQVLVSLPIFVLHWLVVQRDARHSEEEKNSIIRAFFLYAILISALIPVVQNVIALLNRLLLIVIRLNPERALFGGYQSLTDNLIAVAVNIILAVYYYRVLRSNWRTSTDNSSLLDTRRLYHYTWMLYSLGLTILGVQRLVVFCMDWSSQILGNIDSQLANSIALLIIGVPLWVYWWLRIQASIANESERRSTLRLVLFYIISLTAIVVFSVNTGRIIYSILSPVFNNSFSILPFIKTIAGPISMALPFGIVWVYFSGKLFGDIYTLEDRVQQSALKRLYHTILSAIGLAGTVFGLAGVLSVMIDIFSQEAWIGGNQNQRLATGLAVLVVSLALWLAYWLPVNKEAQLPGEEGDHARRSLSRKIYLYLAVFACVIGVMASSGLLIYTVLQHVFGSAETSLMNDSLQDLRLVIIFTAFLAYHLSRLRFDNKMVSKQLAEKQANFPALALVEPESGMGVGLKQAFLRNAAGVPLRFVTGEKVDSEQLKGVGVVIVESSRVEGKALSQLLPGFKGKVIILPVVHSQYIWAGALKRDTDIQKACALAVLSLAEGLAVKPAASSSPWVVVGYIFAAIVCIQILFGVLAALFG